MANETTTKIESVSEIEGKLMKKKKVSSKSSKKKHNLVYLF